MIMKPTDWKNVAQCASERAAVAQCDGDLCRGIREGDTALTVYHGLYLQTWAQRARIVERTLTCLNYTKGTFKP